MVDYDMICLNSPSSLQANIWLYSNYWKKNHLNNQWIKNIKQNSHIINEWDNECIKENCL